MTRMLALLGLYRGSWVLTNGVADSPGDKGGCDYGRLFGCSCNVPGDHGETETLGGPERQSDVVVDEETGLCGQVLIFDCH